MKWVSVKKAIKLGQDLVELSTYGSYLARMEAVLVMKVGPGSNVWTKVSKRLILLSWVDIKTQSMTACGYCFTL